VPTIGGRSTKVIRSCTAFGDNRRCPSHDRVRARVTTRARTHRRHAVHSAGVRAPRTTLAPASARLRCPPIGPIRWSLPGCASASGTVRIASKSCTDTARRAWCPCRCRSLRSPRAGNALGAFAGAGQMAAVGAGHFDHQLPQPRFDHEPCPRLESSLLALIESAPHRGVDAWPPYPSVRGSSRLVGAERAAPASTPCRRSCRFSRLGSGVLDHLGDGPVVIGGTHARYAHPRRASQVFQPVRARLDAFPAVGQ
jgi:hypothetical protein